MPSGALAGAAGLVLRSRSLGGAAVREGLELAEEAWAADYDSAAALLNLVAARSVAGDVLGALGAGRLLERSSPPHIAALARVYRQLMDASVEGSVEAVAEEPQHIAARHRQRGETHYLGVALCNEAQMRLAMGEAEAALMCANEAISVLGSSSAGMELVSARLARSAAVAYVGDILEARNEIETAMRVSLPGERLEVAIEAADVELFYGQPSMASAHLGPVETSWQRTPTTGTERFSRWLYRLRRPVRLRRLLASCAASRRAGRT